MKALAEETYGKLPSNPDVRAIATRPKDPPQIVPRRIDYKDPRAGAASFHRTYTAPSYVTAKPGEAEALDLLMKIAATGPTSRLYKKAVVEQKVASSASGDYAGYGLDGGTISIVAVANDGVPLAKVEAVLDEVLADVVKNGVTEKELERAKNAYIADYVYESDNQATLARRYGWGLAVGRTVAQIESWPKDIAKVTADDIKKVAAEYLDMHHSVSGDDAAGQVGRGATPGNAPGAGRQRDGEVIDMMTRIRAGKHLARAQASAFALLAGLLTASLEATPASAMNIQTIKSPGGIEAWLVEEHSVPMMALRFAFDGGNSQDPAGKEGVANFITAMMDEGAGDIASAQFQERVEDISMRMSWNDSKDSLYGNFETLSANRDKAVDLFKLAVTKPRFDKDAVDRIRQQLSANLAYSDKDPDKVAAKAWFALAFDGHPYGRSSNGTQETIAAIKARISRPFTSARSPRTTSRSLPSAISQPLNSASCWTTSSGRFPPRPIS